jgi:methanogenic corrinoid protein MtbC1
MKTTNFSDDINAFENALLSLDRLTAQRIISEKSKDLPITSLLETFIVPSLDNIGRAWEEGRVALSQVYMSGRICETLVDSFLPPGDARRIQQPTIAITVLEDYHLLGKRIVYSSLRASGFELFDYGHRDMDTILEQVEKDKVEILLISVLMLRSALRVRDLVARLKKSPRQVKVVVGGAPFRFDPNLWQEVSADAMGANAADAINIVTRMAGEMRK